MRLLAVLLVAACARPAPPPGDPAPATAPADAAMAPVVDAHLAVEPRFACRRRDGVTALLRVRSATPDCSGIGNAHLLLDVVEVAATEDAGAPGTVHLRCPLYSPCAPLGGAEHRPGALFVGTFAPRREPERSVDCVRIPPVDGELLCGEAVDSLEAGRRRLRP